jgi:hypothetical protein
MRKVLILAAVLMIGGCATQVMQGYIGRPVQSAMASYGPPDVVFEMPDGRRAFQWVMTSSGVTPRQSYGQANIYAPPGAFAQVNTQTMTFGGNPYSMTCRYTMYATWNGSAWIFDSYEPPAFGC